MCINSMRKRLRLIRRQIEKDLAGSVERWFFSPALYAQYRAIMPLIKCYVRGRVIDLGCGVMPLRDLLIEMGVAYHSLDLWPHSEEVTYVGDIQNMPMVPTASYDAALCLEVLEHVPRPSEAIREIYRILRPGGILILSVPHLSRLHDEPHDYFRFTAHGICYLLNECGFDILEIVVKGGLLSFLGHQISTVLLGLAWPMWGVRQVIWFVNKWLLTRLFYVMDQRLGVNDLFPLGYAAVARKPFGG